MCKALIFFSLLLFQFALGQTKLIITVVDATTEEPMPFVKVARASGQIALTDVDGKLEIDVTTNELLVFRFYNFKEKTFTVVDAIGELTIELEPDTQILDEVTVRPGENRAHRIIRNAMNERKNNDPLRNNSFQYKSYSRFTISAESDEVLNKDQINDSSIIRLMDLMEKQYLFLTETSSTRLFSPPSFDEEVVHSFKVSGTNNPLFATLSNQLQSFSFYDNVFTILDKEYINPIAPGSIRRYLFVLEDTLISGADSTFAISFRPRKGKNFDGMKGYLYINTNGWALERVIAEPYEESETFTIKVIHEYRYTAGKKWFPYQINTEFQFPGLALSKMHYMAGKSAVRISDVEFDVPIKKRFNAIKLVVEEGAANDTLKLDQARGASITEKERTTYEVIDSIAKESNLDRLINAMTILATGKAPVGMFSFPLQRLFTFNQQEGYRLGLGIETNNRLSRHFNLGGYFAYGFRDREWKWGGYSEVNLYPRQQLKLGFFYTDDVFERGGIDFREDEITLNSPSALRTFFVNNMDRERKASIALSGLVTQNFKVQLLGNYRRIWYFDDYRFDNSPFPTGGWPIEYDDQFDVAETGVIINWNIREKVMMLEGSRFSLGTPYPKITFKGTKGWNTIFDGAFDYYRLNLKIEQDFSIRGFGRLNLQSISGMTIGDVPLILNQMPFASGINWTVTVPHTFETMQPAEFYSDKYTAFFTRFSFLPIKNNTKWTEPLISLHNAFGFGEMENRFNHLNADFSVPHKGFYESGVIIDNLLISGFTGLGLGVFYRYGEYAFENLGENFFFKLSLAFKF
jgi:hypothetical protein